jgi:hypothetical protein
MDWQRLPCSLRTPRGVLWLLGTTLVMFVVEGVFIRLWPLREGISIPF